MGYVGLRTLEAGIIAVGVVPLLAVVTLRQDTTGTASADTTAGLTLGNALVEFHNWTRLLGPGLVCGANTVLMAYLMYRSRLVPRFIPVLGLVGGPLVFAYHTAQMFGASEQILSWAAIGVIPIFAWEVTLASRLIAKGFNPSALASLSADPDDGVLKGVHQPTVVPSNSHRVSSKGWRRVARTKGWGVAAPALRLTLVDRSAWKGFSRKFAGTSNEGDEAHEKGRAISPGPRPRVLKRSL